MLFEATESAARIVLLCFKPPSPFCPSFLPIIYLHVLHIFLDCARKSLLSLCSLSGVSLGSRMSSNSFLFFFAMCSRTLPSARTLSLFLLSPRELPRPCGCSSPQLDFPRFAYFLLHSLPLHLRVSAVTRILSSDLSPHTRQQQPCVRTFFRYDGFLRSVSGFLSDPYSRSRSPFMHQSVVPVVRFLLPR